ncbi:dUTP diphosphatase [uncultured Roseobacter sp.]|uniref:dUTP diphosphatase n=1 Tax=uncultured Roseobacter sp. TaxID=114847 RepID=UPI002633959A|nr:dUTP diphosphatase [uncultured Roseobacter sp.]
MAGHHEHVRIALEWADDADRTMDLPAYQTVGAAGADVRANLPGGEVIIQTGARALIPTGLRMEIPEGYEVQVRPRSGLALHHGLMLVNSPGTIDSDYRGPLGIIVLNAGESPFKVTHGMRIAQLVVAPVVRARFRVVGQLSDTDRNTGGFGSTGRS